MRVDNKIDIIFAAVPIFAGNYPPFMDVFLTAL
jgi:hypothetical protein